MERAKARTILFFENDTHIRTIALSMETYRNPINYHTTYIGIERFLHVFIDVFLWSRWLLKDRTGVAWLIAFIACEREKPPS